MLTLPPLRLVRQEDPWGCMFASLAMVMGLSYAEAKALVHPYHFTKPGFNGINQTHMEGILSERGYAIAMRFLHFHSGAGDRDVWPPAPWADRHICEVHALSNGGPHAVVLRADGRVFDPWHGEVESLARYPRVLWVAAVYRVRADPLPDAVVGPEWAGIHRPRVCECANRWPAEAA